MRGKKKNYTEIKRCESCGKFFPRNKKFSPKQWEEVRYCSRYCGAWSRGLTKYDDERIMQRSRVSTHTMTGRTSWNKGLTKQTDERVAKNGIRISEVNKGRPIVGRMLEGLEKNRLWCKGKTKDTDERLAKRGIAVGNALRGRSRPDISAKQRERYKKHPEQHPNAKLAKKSKGNGYTYIEKFLSQYLDEIGVQSEFNKRVGTKWVDFAVGESSLAIEADGERWHQDKNAEKSRDEYLQEKGWNVLHLTGKEIVNNPEKCKQKIQANILRYAEGV